MIDIIPAIDIIGGKCVRLTEGDYNRKSEYGDPLDMALRFQDHGIKRLHMVDLDGAKEGKIVNYKIIEKIASKTNLVIDAGGGLKTTEDLKIVFSSGASMATGGSIAVKDPSLFEEWLQRYGNDRIILGSDFRNGMIAVSGWLEETNQELVQFLRQWIEKGIIKTICTDISKDGVLQGPAEEIYVNIKSAFPELYLVASGGVADIDDIISLDEAGIPAVIIGKAIYEGKIQLKDLEKYIN
ncbi:1-(5-phosphoribosyl)-5-[(5-phosphoribosylamino)methylideneamino]imidazole-4-carboxamide isomerase [Bacteroidota bacterium]